MASLYQCEEVSSAPRNGRTLIRWLIETLVLSFTVLSLLLVTYRKATRPTVAHVPGPEAESFIFGIYFFNRWYHAES